MTVQAQGPGLRQPMMQKMGASNKHLPLGHRAERYWAESRQPLASLIFILPLLAIYEAGVLLFGVQNGADQFMRRVLDVFGLGQHLLLPMLTVCILLGWQYLSRLPWRVSPGVVSAMAAESILLGLCLRLVPYLQNCVMAIEAPAAPGILRIVYEKMQNAVGFIGAGIYEELLFRLILLSLLTWGLLQTGMKPRICTIAAVLLSSLIFAAAHHVGPSGLEFNPYDFIFRTVAGVFFSVVFIYRGFGIAAGSHAVYDILVGVF